jgi:hypothetical protein
MPWLRCELDDFRLVSSTTEDQDQRQGICIPGASQEEAGNLMTADIICHLPSATIERLPEQILPAHQQYFLL